MEKCFNSKKNTIICFILLILSGMCGVVFFVAAALLFPNMSSLGQLFQLLFVVFLGLLIIGYGLFSFLVFSREYLLDERGITLRYLKRIIVFYPWDKISQICVCVIHRANNGATEDAVIWCSVGNVRHSPPDTKSRWKWNSFEYGLLHFRNVITIELSPERLKDFQKLSKRSIPDYR